MTGLVISLLLVFTLNLHAANQNGTSTAQFLRISQGARAEGMGGAFTAIANDAYAVHFNPAGLAQISKRMVAFNHMEYIEKINSQYAAFVLPVNPVAGSLGVDVAYVNMGNIERFDAGGAALSGETKVDAYSATLAWGQAIGNMLALGVGGKYFKQNLAGTADSSFAGDVGVLIHVVPNRLAVGASALNIGPKLKVGTVEESIPFTVRGGAAYYAIPKKLVFSAEAEKERDTDAIGHIGAEYVYMGRFVARAGYRDPLGSKGGWGAGLGYIWKPGSTEGADFFGKQDKAYEYDEGVTIRIDYAFVDYGDFDATHRIGVHFSF